MPDPDHVMQARIVYHILNKETEKAMEMLAAFYRIRTPALAVGTVKGKRRTAYAVYVGKEAKIYAMNSDILYNPFVMIHEFYHHLRSQGGIHRGTEKHADNYAKMFIESYKEVAARSRSTNPEKN